MSILADHTPIPAQRVVDHPTRAKPAVPNPLLFVPLVLMLREVLERRGEITLRIQDLSDPTIGHPFDQPLGLTDFLTDTCYVDESLDEATFRWTLVHELLHVVHGPAGARFADAEETRIEAATAAVMLDAAASLVLQVHAERTGRDVADVDTQRARHRIAAAMERHLAGGAR